MNPEVNYTYRATLSKVVDGDTVDLYVDCGFGIYTKQRLRLYGINTPEIRGSQRPQGLAAKEYVIKRFAETQEITVRTIKDRKGKYGRYLAIIYLDGENLNEELVTEGHAERVNY
jgi:micrococcal nuclease